MSTQQVNNYICLVTRVIKYIGTLLTVSQGLFFDEHKPQDMSLSITKNNTNPNTNTDSDAESNAYHVPRANLCPLWVSFPLILTITL